jgi:hypothetical protein
MLHEVPVDSLPDNLSFPSDLQPRIHYDASRRRIAYEGFMSKATFDRLYGLADDNNYRRALEELFQVCTFEDATDRGWSRGLVCLAIGLASIATVVAAALIILG